VSETAQGAAPARVVFERILVDPTSDDLWALQKALLALDADDAAVARARTTARAFHACLRTLDSKSASRRASRWGAVLGTAAVGAVSAGEVDPEQQSALRQLMPALLEVGAAVKTAEAWEVEAGLVYDDLAWFLYDELWAVSSDARADLSTDARREEIDRLIDPLLDAGVPDTDKAALVVSLFRAVLAARVVPLLEPR
jgi:hypothetical protein